VATRLLVEMNHEVRGDAVEESPEDILRNKPDFFKSFTLVIAADIGEKSLRRLSEVLWEGKVPLMVVRSYGFIGYIRLQVEEHAVVESHPANEMADLRLDRPFPGLVRYMDAMDLDSMDKQKHGHTPYLVILYKCLQSWRETHGGLAPKNYREKQEFKELIRAGIRKNEESGVPEDEENFEEALQAVNTSLNPTRIPTEVSDILADEKCGKLTAKSNNFWFICRAVRDFVEAQGSGACLPLRGTIPDMFSDSERYIQLQNVYREQADDDVEQVMKGVRRHLEAVGRPPESISEESVRRFCKECANIRVVRSGSSIAAAEFEGKSPFRDDVAALFESNPDSSAAYYFILRGADRFYSEYNSIPGAIEDHVEPDIGKLRSCASKVLCEYGLCAASASAVCRDDFVHEICRYGGCELHAVASILGGCAAQEAIKLLTKQYVPVDNLFVFNAVKSETVSLKV